MNNFMIIRNRTLHGLVLGLVVISFMAYFRTGSIEANLPTAALIHSRVGASEAQNVSLNGTAECPVTGSSRIASQDSLRRGGLQRGGNESTSQPVAPSSSIVQTSSMSSSPEGINVINETMSPDAIARMTNTSKETTATSTSTTTPSTTTRSYTYPPDSAGAMYRAGHDVTASGKCPSNGANLSLAIVIASAPGHVEARKAVRQTWGHYDQRKDIAIIFVLGTTNDTKLDKLLHLEEDLYGDIVRGRFVDSYSNLTLKTISSLEWIRNYCAGAKFVLKTDDDMFINVPRLLAFVQRRENERNVIFGRLARKWKPFRNKKSKYYVPFYQYKPAHFPDFTTGPAYLLSRDVVDKLFTAALEHTYLKLEDVFVAGIVAEKLGVRRIHANEFYNTRIAHTACNVQRAISIHMVKYKEQFDLWKKLLDGTTKCQ